MPVELTSRFTVDDGELSALHARAFGGDACVDTAVDPAWQRRGIGLLRLGGPEQPAPG